MSIEIKVPTLGESVTEATVAKWFKSEGDAVEADEALLELETDKVTLEVFAPSAGTVEKIVAPAGSEVAVGAVLGLLGEGKGMAKPAAAKAPKPQAPATAPKAPETKAPETRAPETRAPETKPVAGVVPLAPSVRKMVAEKGIEPSIIAATGKGGRITKGDVIAHLEKPAAVAPRASGPREERVKMTRLRRRIAERLKEAQNTAAMLTTFNEVDMSAILDLRQRYRDAFEKRHGVRLGFMSFFVKASIAALKEFPAVNAEIDGDEIVYKNHYDIGVAVGSGQGLVVPVVRDADQLGFGEVEKTIAELGQRARDGRLALEDLTGGTFTISNGGVYGSLLSTPILNTPQSGILGMHKTQDRAVVIGGKVEVRPMMYLALSYDHRIVDGREAVSFLIRIKECLEDPSRMLFEV
ncbi:MAG: 2-oxoglutarate dehydrogenase complex dihydrolipoyllysine-residue succinyltransferase [Alphaproteobacteria bacterium]